MYQVDCEDANFLFLDNTDSPTHIGLVALYDTSGRDDGVIRFRHVVQLLEKRLAGASVFARKIKRLPADIDYPYWVDDPRFDLDYHVRHMGLPKPGDWRQFCIQISRLHSRPLDLTRPLWELYVIEGLDHVEGLPAGSFALYLKIHHAAMDEFAAVELFESLHQTRPNPRQHEESAQPIAHLPARAPGALQALTQAALNNTLRAGGLVWQTVRNYRTMPKLMARVGVRLLGRVVEGETLAGRARTRFMGPLGSARVFEGVLFNRRAIDALVAQVPGATASDGLMLVCGEALRRYLAAHGEAPAASLAALHQLNLRHAGAHALVGNRIAVEPVELYTTTPGFIERLHAIVGCRPGIDEAFAEQRGFQLRALYEHLPAPLHSLLGRYANRRGSLARQMMQGGDFGFAELRGQKQTLYLLGARLHAYASVSPLYSGCGLMFSAATYGERIALSFTSDREMLRDPECMRQCLLDTLHDLRAQLPAPDPAAPAAAPKPRRRARQVGAGATAS